MKTSLSPTETCKLREVLYAFTENLSQNFLERRGSQENHKSTILEELEDVISIVTHREKDLLSTVHIALDLLDENDELQTKCKSFKQKLKTSQNKINHLTKEIEALQDTLIAAESRYEHLNKTLIETEDLMLINSAELNRLMRQRAHEANLKETDDEIDKLKKDFRSQIADLEKKNWVSEREKNSLAQKLCFSEQEANMNKEQCTRLEIKLEKLKKSLKDLENREKTTTNDLEKISIEYQVLNSHYQKLKMKCEKLEEDFLISFNKETSKTRLSAGLSLRDELEEIFDDSDKEEFSKDSVGSSSTKLVKLQRATSLSYLNLLSNDKIESIQVLPVKVQRKSPPEEYFALSVQAVKMSSPHMDNIINASASQLYAKAIQLGVPFHKWHLWIESQLNSIYVKTIYTKKGTWSSYTKKMCLGSS